MPHQNFIFVRRGERLINRWDIRITPKLLKKLRWKRHLIEAIKRWMPAEEMRVSSRALCRWRTKFAYKTQMQPTFKRPQDYDAEEIFQTLLEFEKLTEEKRGEFLRKKGLHTEHLKLWREQIKVALHPAKQSRIERSEKAQDRRKIKELERELRRKDKALAEATALLILKKKPT